MFAFTLALRLGIWDVDAMLQAMPSSLLTEWFAFANLNPIGDDRGDLQAGIVASTVARSLGGSRCTPFDFMPKFGRAPEPNVEAMKSAFRAFARRSNKGDKR